MAEIVGLDLPAFSQLIGYVVIQRAESSVHLRIARQALAEIFISLRIVNARVPNPQLQVVLFGPIIVDNAVPVLTPIDVDGKDFPGHLFNIKAEIIIENVLEIAIAPGNRAVTSCLPQLPVKAVGVMRPGDDVAMAPRIRRRRKQETCSIYLRDSIYLDADPVCVGEPETKVK